MAALAAVVFVVLFFVDAGYGKMISHRWGPAISNKAAWVLMEAPVFIVLLVLFLRSTRPVEVGALLCFLCFELHYFQRSFVFPFLLKGKSKMPLSIMFMGMIFNTVNGWIQGQWLFYLSPEGMYGPAWLHTPQLWIGMVIFFVGMAINIHSDYIIRHLRQSGDTRHYLPHGGMYDYVTSANYLGEIIEWTGYAIMTWSAAGLLFVVWTCANLVPRANSIYKRYQVEFANEFDTHHLKRIFPYIY